MQIPRQQCLERPLLVFTPEFGCIRLNDQAQQYTGLINSIGDPNCPKNFRSLLTPSTRLSILNQFPYIAMPFTGKRASPASAHKPVVPTEKSPEIGSAVESTDDVRDHKPFRHRKQGLI
jgi:hypothetical protein